MEWQPLDLTIISAKGLKNVNLFSKMKVYAVASLSSDGRSKKKTPVDKEGGKNPTWNFSTEFSIPTSSDPSALFLHIRLKCHRFLGHRVVGEVNVPVRDLLLAQGKPTQFVSYQVRKPSGKPKGVLSLSYKLHEREAQGSDEPAPSNPAQPAANPYMAPPPHLYGYPPVGNQVYGYGFGYPPVGSQDMGTGSRTRM